MKLFKPVIAWSEIDGQRKLSFRIKDNDIVSVSVVIDDDHKEADIKVVPEVDESAPLPPEIEFLMGVHAMVQQPLMLWLGHPDQHTRNVGLAALGSIFHNIALGIENTPRATEAALELSLQCYLTEVPPAMGLLIFMEEIMKKQVEPMSEFEKQMHELHGNNTNMYEVSEAVRLAMQPLTYQCMVPEVPEAFKQELEDERVKRRTRQLQ